jgi:ATP-binding cassette subfamily C protein LapB
LRVNEFLKFLGQELSRFPRLTTVLVLVSLALPGVEILVPIVLGKILNLLVINVRSADQSDLMLLLSMFLIANIVKAILTAFQLRFGFALDASILEGVRSRILRSVIRPRGVVGSPELVSLSMHFQALSKFWGAMLWETLTSLLFMLGASIALFATNQQLAAAAFLPVPLVLGVVLVLGPRFKRTMDAYYTGVDAVGQELLEVSENQEFIKVSRIGNLVQQIFERANRQLTDRAKAFGFWAALYAPIFDFVAAAATALLVMSFVFWVAPGSISAETFLVFFVYLSYFYRPLYGASALVESWQKTFAAYEKIRGMEQDVANVWREAPQLLSGRSAFSATGVEENTAVKFENVSFAYPDGQPIAFELNARISANQRSAIIGGNGLGKSTVIKMLVGLLEPHKGRVSLSDRHRSIAYLPQTVFLHSGSILDNLLMAHPGYNLDLADHALRDIVEKIVAIGEQIGVTHKLSKIDLNQKRIGSPGKQLSGGQRQLIGLWRFAVQSEFADLLVMDEPDAYLDIEGLNKVLPLLLHRLQKKTTVIVTHNAKLLDLCDAVFRLENGKLSQELTS